MKIEIGLDKIDLLNLFVSIRVHLWLIFGLTIQFLLIGYTGMGLADNLSLNGDIVYTGRESKVIGKTTTSSSLSQNYSIIFDKKFTNTIRMTGDVRASNSRVGSTEDSSVSPSLFLGMNNRYFNSTLGYQVNDRFLSTGNKITTTSNNAIFSTTPEGYPSLRFTYNELLTKDKLNLVNSRQSYINTGTDYTINRLNLLYNYTSSTQDDFIAQVKQETPTHLGTITYGNSFFNNRLNFNMNLGGTSAKLTNISLSGTPQVFSEKKGADNGLYEIDTLPGDGKLSDYPSLINDDKSSDTGIDINGSYRNIGLKLKNKDTIHTIYLYVSTSETNIANMNFGWSIYYTNDLSGNNWSVATLSSSSYDEVNSRFKLVLSTATEALFFKVVNTTYDPSAQKISVTEIEAIGSISRQTGVTFETSTERQYGGMNLGLRPTEKLNLSYNATYDQSSQSPTNREDTNINQGVSLSYAASKYASLFLNYQAQSTESSLTKGVGSNNYTLSVSTNPMETINGSFALSLFESLSGGEKTSETNSGNINMFFKLYPGINLGTGFTVSKAKDLIRGSETDTNSINGNLNLLPRKSINILIDGAFSSSASDTGGQKVNSKAESLRSTINITPSRYVNFVTNLQYLPEAKQNYSINSRLPGSLQINVNYNVSETGAETAGGSVYWNISRYLYVSSNYSTAIFHNATGDSSSLYSIAISVRK